MRVYLHHRSHVTLPSVLLAPLPVLLAPLFFYILVSAAVTVRSQQPSAMSEPGPSSAIDLSCLPAEAHQPRKFAFPKRSFGKKVVVNRSFQPSWFEKWPWLHYIESNDAVLCITCAQASVQKKLQWSSNSDLAVISKGFTNWKDATVKFAIHASSKCHQEAVLKMVTLPSSTKNVAETLSTELKREKLERRQCLLKVLSSIRFLA